MAQRKFRRVFVLWVAIAALGLVLGAWIRSRVHERQLRAGRDLVRQVAELAGEAAEAESRGDSGIALESLERALELLRESRGGSDEPAYAALLVDLAAQVTLASPEDPERLREAGSLLETAWAVDRAPPALKARIARDRAALAILEGDLSAAESWYRRADEVSPEESSPGPPFEALRTTQPRERPP